MTLYYLARGILVGIAFGVPVGAIGALTVQRTLEHGFWTGFLTGLGSTAADVCYAAVGVFGLTLISGTLNAHQTVIRVVGSGLIILYGLWMLFRAPREPEPLDTRSPAHLLGSFLSAFGMAMMNPATVLSFLVIFASMGIQDGLAMAEGVSLMAGILLGTGLWWLTLAGITAKLRHRVTAGIYRVLRRVLGGLMIAFGILLLVR